MRRIVPILFLLLTFSAIAQSDEWYIGQTIQDIRFTGLVTVRESDLRPIVEPYIGRPFTERGFQELQRRLFALDSFIDIVPEALRPQTGDGVIVRFAVTERPTVSDIRFVGNRRIRSADLLDTIVLRPGDMITSARRRLAEQAIATLYRERGYPDIQVTSRVDESTVGERTQHAVVFTVTEGRQVTVRQINFSGNAFASASTLRGQMQTKAQNIFNSGVFQSRVLEEDRRRIEQYYRDRGFIDARVVEVAQDVERDEEAERTFLILTVFIEEGSQYSFGGVSFDGNAIFDDAELAALMRLREGAVLNVSRLQEGFGAIQDLYYQSGYIFNEFNLREERNEQLLTVRFVVDIVERPRAHIERIVVRGNDKTATDVVLREIPLRVGDVFSVSRIREGVQNLMNLQYFSSITPETPFGSVDGLMELILNVEEAQTADITFGVAFGGGTEFPISAQVGWSDRNFLGRGQSLGFNVQLSPLEQLLSFNFLERWFAGQRWSVGGDLSVNRRVRSGVPQDILAPIFADNDPNAVPDPFQGYYVFSVNDTEYPTGSGVLYARGDLFPDPVTSDLITTYRLITDYQLAGGTTAAIPQDYLMDYVDWSISVGGNTGYRFRTTLGTLALATNLRSSLNFVGYDPQQFRPASPQLRANLGRWQLVNQWGLNASLDRRRGLALSPSSGYRVSQGATLVGGFLLGDRHYIRTDTRAETYFTLWNWQVFENWSWKGVLGAQSSLALIFPQFWVPASFRTDPQVPIAGADLLSTNPMFVGRGWDARLNGQALWNNSLELRMPIAEQIVWLDTFMDGVGIWDRRQDITELSLDDMLFSIGTGLRFTIPQFPIRIYLAKRFRFDENNQIEWQQGSLFNRDGRPTGGLDFVFAIGGDLF
ncbi:MAG: outer membrane protein assembly factor BamA [Spirochaetaceae bacterium]|nr:MAG: outer membrane protein assembly factor BamA [Spirochaetaceae bacterium]